MDSQLDNPKRKPLVTVEFQTEVDIATGDRERRMFVKMYFDARDSGLLARLAKRTLEDSLLPRDRSGFENQLASVWDRAVSANDFINEQTVEVDWLVRNLALAGNLTVPSSPRGLGKTHVAIPMAVAKAVGGLFRGERLTAGRGLYVDTENPKTEMRRRFRAWGAESVEDNLKLLTRDNGAPALTDAKAWSQFPVEQFELVIIDSLSAATEAVGERDGGESGKALAGLLDVARPGPGVVVLANTRKDWKVLRGSRVIGDRFDIVYEIRDATQLRLDAKRETWVDCLPDETSQAGHQDQNDHSGASVTGSPSSRRNSELVKSHRRLS